MEKGMFVKVSGLQSKEGSKLNGALGMIIGQPTKAENDVSRYPVLVFALVGAEDGVMKAILVDAPKRKIKQENLTEIVVGGNEENNDQDVMVLTMFQQSAVSHVQSAHELGTKDKVTHLLAEQCYKKFPEDTNICIYYAKSLVETTSNSKRAAEVLKPLLPKALADEEDDKSSRFPLPACYVEASEMFAEFSRLFSSAGDTYFQDAFDCAKKICTDSSSFMQVQQSIGALQVLQGECSRILHNTQINQDPDIVALFVESCRMAIKIAPQGDEQPELVSTLASALSIAGYNLEASKYHRKVLAMENLQMHPGLEENEKICLVLSQFQCPGMPLADAFVLSVTDNRATCIKKLDAEDCSWAPTFPGGPMTLMAVGSPPKIFHYDLPNDPDDPNVFPAWLLEATKPDKE